MCPVGTYFTLKTSGDHMPTRQTFHSRLSLAIAMWEGGGRKAFARRMKESGVRGHTYRTLLNYLNPNTEEGGTTPSPVWIEAAARVTQVRLEWLRDGEGEARYEGELSRAEEEGAPNYNEVARRAGMTVPALVELLRDQEEGFRDVWDETSWQYGDMFRRTAMTLASTGAAITLAHAADELITTGDLTKGRLYAKQYRMALRLLASCVSTVEILRPPGEKPDLDSQAREPDSVHLEALPIDGREFFQFQQLINIGQLVQDPSFGFSIDLTMARLADGHPMRAPWSVDESARIQKEEEPR